MTKRQITIAHSPDPDDAFMFYALTQGKIETPGLDIRHELRDIETLNQWALAGKCEVSALSLHAYAHVSDRYALLDSGASIGYKYGPVLVAKKPIAIEELSKKVIAVPGRLTSAVLYLQLWQPDLKLEVIPFDRIFDAVKRDQVDAGLIIHEGQLTYRDEGFVKLVDLGEWWFSETGLPLPLGANVVRRDLGPALMRDLAHLQRESIRYALAHRAEALAFAERYGRDLDTAKADRFVGMYVNERTAAYGDDDKRAIMLMLERAHARGIIPRLPAIEFVA